MPIARNVIAVNGANVMIAANEANVDLETGVTRAAGANAVIAANLVNGAKVTAAKLAAKPALPKVVEKAAASVVRSRADQNRAPRNLAVVVAGATTAVAVRRANQPLPAVALATV